MRKIDFDLSEESVATKIMALHNQGLGVRKISRELFKQGIMISKDKVHQIYQKHRLEQTEIEVEDKETERLKKKETRAQIRLNILKKKKNLKKRITNLYVNRYMENYEKRRKVFTDDIHLLRFAKRVMPFVNPQLWYDFMEYCGEEYDFSGMLAIALGDQTVFEEKLLNNNFESPRLDNYLEQQLKEALNQWKEADIQEIQEKEDPNVTLMPDGSYIATIERPIPKPP